MAELANYILSLKRTGIKTFLENLEHELTKEELQTVREWAFKISRVKCNQCGHVWVPRIENPRQCARCHSVRWDKEPKK